MKALFFLALGAYLTCHAIGMVHIAKEKEGVNWGGLVAFFGAIPLLLLAWGAGF